MNFDLALKYSRKLQKETFFTNPLFIMQNCFVKNNLVFENQKIQNQYPLLVFSTIYTNIPNHIIGTGFDEDLSIIKKKYFVDKIDNLGLEFIYSTNDWITLEGKSFRSIRKNINKFQKEHNIKVLFEYPKEKIINFLNYWAQDKRQKNVSDLTKELFEHELKESIKNLELVRNINYKAIYLEENGTLIGFCIFFNYYDSFWIALMQKTKLGIRGIPQYLYHLKSKEMGKNQFFTTGAEAQDENLKKFKESLRPCKIKKIYTIFIGSKKTNKT